MLRKNTDSSERIVLDAFEERKDKFMVELPIKLITEGV
jgi:hypothetical protein